METFRAAVIGCGRMGSTIDDEAEAVNSPHYPYPWAHAAALHEARGIELVAGADLDEARLADFRRRWGVSGLYTDFRRMLSEERPDIVSVTTRPAERLDVIIACAEAGVRAIFATKPLAHSLAEADQMVDVCRQRGVLFATAAHLNWDPWYEASLALFESPDQPVKSQAEQPPDAVAQNASVVLFPNPRRPMGRLRSMICHSPHTLSNIHSHTLCLFRRFAGAPVQSVIGEMNSDEAAAQDQDLVGSGYLVYANGVRGFLNAHAGRTGLSWNMEFLGEHGWVSSINAHAHFEAWALLPSQREPCRLQFPNPRRPRSSMLAAVESIAQNLRTGTAPACPGEYGREGLEVAIALRESHRRGCMPVHLPLEDRSLRIDTRR
ncbi:MAG: Gfo/Idh/MocA family oxidoreductase [Chloroflexi bacterium]|nr:Gfo/Idh/MocA family oxidoreductase [Chloroflexota bacterium]